MPCVARQDDSQQEKAPAHDSTAKKIATVVNETKALFEGKLKEAAEAIATGDQKIKYLEQVAIESMQQRESLQREVEDLASQLTAEYDRTMALETQLKDLTQRKETREKELMEQLAGQGSELAEAQGALTKSLAGAANQGLEAELAEANMALEAMRKQQIETEGLQKRIQEFIEREDELALREAAVGKREDELDQPVDDTLLSKELIRFSERAVAAESALDKATASLAAEKEMKASLMESMAANVKAAEEALVASHLGEVAALQEELRATKASIEEAQQRECVASTQPEVPFGDLQNELQAAARIQTELSESRQEVMDLKAALADKEERVGTLITSKLDAAQVRIGELEAALQAASQPAARDGTMDAETAHEGLDMAELMSVMEQERDAAMAKNEELQQTVQTLLLRHSGPNETQTMECSEVETPRETVDERQGVVDSMIEAARPSPPD